VSKRNGRVPVPDFPDYEVSRRGRVYKVHGRYAGNEIKSHVSHPYGYLKIKLTNRNGQRVGIWLHRLVCRAFHGEPPVYGDRESIVRHLDNDPGNNKASNLRWGTKEENERDKKKFYGGW
jgi:hypothetical protein